MAGEETVREVIITNDAITLGILLLLLAGIFVTHGMPAFRRFYTFVPALLLCYFLPGLLNTFDIVDGDSSRLYFVASRYLLPASLVLLCLSVDLKGILNLGPKALIMFFTATVGIIIGAPVALAIVSAIHPDLLSASLDDPNAIYKGLSSIAGSWIGGGANQTAMIEISGMNKDQLPIMALVDVFVANIWMAFLLIGAGRSLKLDRRLKADNSAIDTLRKRIENYQASIARNPSTTDLFVILAVAFVGVAFGHLVADWAAPTISTSIQATMDANPDHWLKYLTSLGSGFFWLIIVATLVGVGLSFTPLRKYEGAGASKIGSVMLYILVTTIGLHIDFGQLVDDWKNVQWVFYIGVIWMLVHVVLLLLVAFLIKAPFFFVAVGSQANVGGAASAPVVASAFAPALAPVGVLLAVLGYVIGTVGAIVCMELMKVVY